MTETNQKQAIFILILSHSGIFMILLLLLLLLVVVVVVVAVLLAARRSAVEALRCKSEGRGFDSR